MQDHAAGVSREAVRQCEDIRKVLREEVGERDAPATVGLMDL